MSYAKIFNVVEDFVVMLSKLTKIKVIQLNILNRTHVRTSAKYNQLVVSSTSGVVVEVVVVVVVVEVVALSKSY